MVAFRRLAALWFGLALLNSALAIGPKRIPDDKLAQFGIIVEGYWPKANIRGHYQKSGDSITEYESHTQLVVTRVIHGALKPGRHSLVFGWGIGWDKDGKNVGSYTSTDNAGFVDDVSKPNLWFLEWKRSWDSKDPRLYLSVQQYSCVQPKRLAAYYEIMRRPDRETAIAACLQSSNELTVQRAISFTLGWWPVWPDTPARYLWDSGFIGRGRKEMPKTLPRHLPLLSQILDRGPRAARADALTAYAYMAGRSGIPRLRSLLRDRDARVAGIAAGYLIRHRDSSSTVGITKAISRVHDPYLKTEIATVLGAAQNESFVPALIGMLDDTEMGGMTSGINGFQIGMSALMAQQALEQIVGYTFPVDSERSLAAWKAVRNMKDPIARLQTLTAKLGDWTTPILATYSPVLDRKGDYVTVKEEGALLPSFAVRLKLTNTSPAPLTLSKSFSIDTFHPSGAGGGWSGQDGVIRLLPGQSFTIRSGIFSSELFTVPSKCVMRLIFSDRDGKKARCWVGVVPAILAR